MNPNKIKDFETFVLEWLESSKTCNLHWSSDFFESACKNLEIDVNDILGSQRKLRYRLSKMKSKGLITSKRVGSGFMGKTDFGSTSHNCYTLPDFWKNYKRN